MKPLACVAVCLAFAILTLCWDCSCRGLTKEEADSILRFEVIGVDTVSHQLIAFGFDAPLAESVTVFPYWQESKPVYVNSGFYAEYPYINSAPTWS
jgi:hypothetical protein